MHLQDLKAFEHATDSIKILATTVGHKTLSKGVKSLIILDSSFNPPHSAHLALIRNALRIEHEQPVSLLLMYAVKNADKGSNDVRETIKRIKLMEAFSKTTSGLCETHICLTKHPYFVDKFNAIHQQYPDTHQSYIVGYDTLVRILDKKYYPDQKLSNSGLSSFFQKGSLLCAMREVANHGDTAAQRSHIEQLNRDTVDGISDDWGKNIKIIELMENEGLGVSSTRIREAVEAKDDVVLNRYLTPEVCEEIKKSKMYTAEEMDIAFPYLSREHVMNCSFSFWHARFRHISPRARIIRPLPVSFLQYLNEDGLMLPQDSRTVGKLEELSSDSGSEFEDEGFSEEDPTESFQELHERIRKEMEALGGAVVPKLNWSSPKDALWITADKTLKCTSPSDIYLLLKSSDFIVHDLEEPFKACNGEPMPMKADEYELVLKKWFNAQPSMEFRCFVKDSHLVAVSQRDINYYDFLTSTTSDVASLAARMLEEHLKHGFPDPNFVFDIYASVDQNKAWLMDINPFSPATDALLFEWAEILAMVADTAPEIRLVSKDSVMSQGPQYSTNTVPYDLIDSSDGVDPAEFAREFQQRLSKVVLED